MAPFVVIYIINWIIFILIFVSLLRKKSNLKGDTKVTSKAVKAKLKQQFIIALTLSLLFGLGWGVGFAATTSISYAPISVTLQAIFILLTSFQGLFIFIMHCVRSEEARKVWKGWLYVVTCHKVSFNRKTTKFTSQSATSGNNYRHRVPSNPYGTLTTSMNADSDTLRRAVKKDLESSETFANQSAFASTTLETIQEVEKRDLSLDKEEKVKYELLPHREFPNQEEDGESNVPSQSTIFERRKQAVSPFTIDSAPTSPGEDVEMTILSPVSDTFQVVDPKAIHVPKEVRAEKEEEAKVQDCFDILWLNYDGTTEMTTDPLTPTDPVVSSTSPDDFTPNANAELDTPSGGGTANLLKIDANIIFTNNAEETTLV